MERAAEVTTTPLVGPGELVMRSSDPSLSLAWNDRPSHPAEGPRGATTRRLNLSLDPGQGAGPRSASVEVKTPDGRFNALLPITWRSGPRVTVSPAAIFRSGVTPSSSLEVTLILESEGEGPPIISYVSVDGERVADPISSGADAKTHAVLKFAVKAGGKPGDERHSVVIGIGGERPDPIEVPVTFLVR